VSEYSLLSGQVGGMLGSRIIFVGGLPGSAKSTTADYVASQLEQRGIPCHLLCEREIDHPLNVGGDLHPSGSTTGARMFAEYSVRSFVEESLARGSAFVTEAMGSERVTVLDSYPFQNSVRVLLQRSGPRPRCSAPPRQPISRSPSRKASRKWRFAESAPASMNPTRGTALICCAAASGATSAPASEVSRKRRRSSHRLVALVRPQMPG
jgi:hypothetical protein